MTVLCRYTQTSTIHCFREGHLTMWLVVVNFLPLTGKELLSGVEGWRFWCTILGQVVNHFVTRREWWYTIVPYNYKIVLIVCLLSFMKVTEAILVLFCVTFGFYISASSKWSIVVMVVGFEWEISRAPCVKAKKVGTLQCCTPGYFQPSHQKNVDNVCFCKPKICLNFMFLSVQFLIFSIHMIWLGLCKQINFVRVREDHVLA